MLQATLSLFTAVLATGSPQLEEKTLSTPSDERTSERGTPALFSWGDVDGDARLDLAAVNAEGVLQLLANVGKGRFEDVTERVGLSGIANAALALWVDYDSDGRLDLFVGAREGPSRLFHNEGGVFVDMTAASGLASEGAVQSAHWLDDDGDGRLDLFVVTAEKSVLYRGLEGGFFELDELPLAGAVNAPGLGGFPADAPGLLMPPASGPSREKGGLRADGSLDGRVHVDGVNASGGRIALGPTPSIGGVTPLLPFPTSCANSIRDQANPSTCLAASTTPTLGMLYPISANLFVAVGGNVGIGTTTPAARLEVAGTARVTDTLTLAPAGDVALDVSTGSIYKGGALFLHTKGGSDNTALGLEALASVTSGYRNTASGAGALFSNTTGFRNTASGYAALRSNTTGTRNTAIGAYALRNNTTGRFNTASGANALRYNTSGVRNTASGYQALHLNTTGYLNTASGYRALSSNGGGTENTASGAHALSSNTTGYRNTASGAFALFSNTAGYGNTAGGRKALYSSTTGDQNTASGANALHDNMTGNLNTADGYRALCSNTTGYRNTASGALALHSNTGSDNIALGISAGGLLTTGSFNIAIGNPGVAAESATIRIGTAGTHTRAFIAGIRGVTTGVANAIPVLIDSAGQLGTVSSSRRFKEEIEEMGDRTERLLQLRPVVFRYKPEVQSGERPLEYGLIAEEVAEVFPELVVHDDEGKPFTVKYHLLSSMLLNELQKLDERERDHARELAGLRERLAVLETRGAAVAAVVPR